VTGAERFAARAALALAGGTGVTRAAEILAAVDRRIAEGLTRWMPPRPLTALTKGVLWLGDGWVWLFWFGALAAAGDPAAPRAAALAFAAGIVVVVGLKRRVRRRRPAERSAAFPLPPRLHFQGDGFAFPSGHSMNAATLATVTVLHYPLLAPAAVAMALALGASRVVAGYHFTSDVAAAGAMGTAIGLWACGLLAC
jgi:undecaprenyl-diphosphatase